MSRLVSLIVISFQLLLGLTICNDALGQVKRALSRIALWNNVDAAIRKGLDQTARTELDEIVQLAIKSEDYAEATNAIVRRAWLAPSSVLTSFYGSTTRRESRV